MKARVEARRAALGEMLREEPGLRASEMRCRRWPELFDAETLDLIASFSGGGGGESDAADVSAAEAFGARAIVVSGGVAANSELRRRFAEEGERRGLPVAFPTVAMTYRQCGDDRGGGVGEVL